MSRSGARRFGHVTARVRRVRRFLQAGGGAVAVALVCSPAALAANPIQVENAKPGDSYWAAATQDGLSANPPIDGYASATSVRPGGEISFHVATTPSASYRIEIDRLGWYGGSGGRRITCLEGTTPDPTCSGSQAGVKQPAAPSPDPATGEVDAGWSVTDTLAVPSDWVSGYYLAVFRLTSGPSAGQTGFAPFIVQAPVGDRAAILVQVPSNTWQAYNPWGGQDYYSSPRAVKVSFNRPYAHRLLFSWEYPLIRFLERGGWDVSYVTDDGVDADPGILLNHKLDMTAGHDEYWTKRMRDGWEAARAAGVNLAFMGANAGFWQVRYEDQGRTMVGYKYSPDPYPDPAQKTTEFRWLATSRPECELEGEQYTGAVMYHQYADFTVTGDGARDPWFAGSGLSSGSVLPGLVGYETDALAPSCHVPPPAVLLDYSGPPAAPWQPPVRAQATRYTACSGAEVFAAGSLQFSWGLDSWRDPSYSLSGLPPVPPVSPGLQRMTTNALVDLTSSHVPVPGPPEICVPTASFNESASAIGVGQPITLQSTSRDAYGQIAAQTWDVGGLQVSGATATRSFSVPGLYDVSLRVTDASGAASTTTELVPVCPCPATFGAISAGPLASQLRSGNCDGIGFGTLRTTSRRLLFSPLPGISRVTLRKYALRLTATEAIRQPLGATIAGPSAGAVRARLGRPPLLVEATARVDGAQLAEQFVITSTSGSRSIRPSLLAAIGCDGTTGRVLTPAFGGPAHTPLKIALSGHGRVAITVTRGPGAPVYRRIVRLRSRPTVLSFAPVKLSRGYYQIRVSKPAARASSPIALTALRL